MWLFPISRPVENSMKPIQSFLITSFLVVLLPSFALADEGGADEDSEPSWFAEVWDESEVKASLYYRNFENEGYFQDSVFGLAEMLYEGDDDTLDIGIGYQNLENDRVFINHLSYAQEFEDFDYKVGKFVTKVGVMDFVSFIDVFNNTRIEYYDDENVNVRFDPTWMAKIDMYPDENSTFGLYLKPYDQTNNVLFGESIQYGLNSVIPFLVTNTGDADLDLVGEQVLLPVYENDAKPAISSYLLDKVPNEDPRFDNTSIFLNYVVTEDNYTFGALHTSAYSSFPIIVLDQELISALRNIAEEDKEAYVEDYLSKDENEPIKLVEYFRYNQFALYYESSVGQFGFRGEFSYRDKFPLLNRTSGMMTFGLGVDHQSAFYNNVELQYSKFDDSDLSAYYLIWLAKSDMMKVGQWELGLQNMVTYAAYEDNDVTANFSGIRLLRDNFEITIEYLTHSKEEYVSDTASLKLKVML